MTVAVAGPGDVPAVAALVAEAFAPLAVAGWLAADPDRRRAAMAAQFEILVGHAVAHGRVDVIAGGAAAGGDVGPRDGDRDDDREGDRADRDGGGRDRDDDRGDGRDRGRGAVARTGGGGGGGVAAAVWLPSDAPPPADYDRRLAAACGELTPRFAALDAAFDAHHPDGAFDHLALLAVAPGRQSRGLGSLLLRHRHAELDAAGRPAYLEASSERSRALYLRHGYQPRQPFFLPEDGPPFFPMWRPAGAARPPVCA